MIMTLSMGTSMGTNKTNLEIYIELWEKFEYLLNKNNMTLNEFSKYGDKFDEAVLSEKEYKQSTFLDTLKKMQSRKSKLKNVQTNSIDKIKEYIKFLDKGFITQDLHHTETYESLFN